ncbi:MAG: FecR domain-containing protein [Spirochaetes bacterium]|nr:FecR domain-containing protein [Spirochaetota bacterium]
MARTLMALIIIATTALSTQACKQFMPGKNTDGKVKFMVGDVTVNGKKATLGDTVRFDDVIETGDRSICHITIGEKNIIALWPGARFLYRVTTRGSNCELSRGGLGALLRNKNLTGDMNIKTPTVTASVRGTILCLTAESNEKIYTCVCNGRIRFKPEAGGGIFTKSAQDAGEKLVSANHHSGHYFTREQGAIKIEKAGLKHHTDEGVEKMAASIGEKVDWTKIE